MSEPPLHEFPERLEPVMRRSKRLVVAMVGYLVLDVVVLYLLAGGSQAVVALFLEDGLELVPPLVFLASARLARKRPTPDYPYGYHRSVTLAYFTSALALFAFGAAILAVSGWSLLQGPGSGPRTMELFGWEIWHGWVVIVYLIASGTIPFVLGRRLQGSALQLNNKVLFATARMLSADWRSSAAAMLGLLGARAGLWWADPLAAMFIALGVMADGYHNTEQASKSLVDHMPTEVGSDQVIDLVDRVDEVATSRTWSRRAVVRLREYGPVYFGVIIVDVGQEKAEISDLEELQDEIIELDWRIQEVLIVPVADKDQLAREVEKASPQAR